MLRIRNSFDNTLKLLKQVLELPSLYSSGSKRIEPVLSTPPVIVTYDGESKQLFTYGLSIYGDSDNIIVTTERPRTAKRYFLEIN